MEKKSLKIVFMGTSDFAVDSMEAIANSEHNLQAVVTLKDRKAGRGQKMIPTAVKKSALNLETELIEIDSPKEDYLEQKLKELQPDLIVVIAFRILPDSILNIPKYGCVNLHASLLPKYRGPAPINWAIINGDTKTGNTIFFLDSGVDTGKILYTSECEITENMTTGELYEKLEKQGPSLVLKALDSISTNSYELIQQDESVACKAPKLFKDDAKIDFSKDAKVVHNQIRGMNPFPGSHSFFRDKLIKIISSEVSQTNGEIGKIIDIQKDGIFIGCKIGSVKIIKVAPQGKNPMDIASFINGYKPLINEIIG